ncbi:MAG: peptide chain release factor N(5)-glutamine methyltransferase [Treponema sp.]|nr:peptide chain release factor N(5)-glutamine methyltransferase [Treponema sp.]
MTVREALAGGSAALAGAGTENAQLDASLLLAGLLNMSRSSLVAAASRPLAEESLAAFNSLIKRRLAGECVAYITGKKEFYGLEFLVNPSVLVPRPDTETLVEAALQKLKNENQPLRVLDLCTGSGAIAVALKHEMPELEVWAADISAAALETARTNAARLLTAGKVHFCHGDLFDALNRGMENSFHIIISNPPYIPGAAIAGLSPEVRMEPILALDGGNDGLDVIKRIVSQAPQFLCPGGSLLLEADPRQIDRIGALFQQADFTGIQAYKDLSGKERVIGGAHGIQ